MSTEQSLKAPAVMKRRKRTSKHVPAKGRLRDMADQLWSKAVLGDWAGKCAVCGAGKSEAHHLIPRQHQSTRYDLRNGIALCVPHHQFDKDISPHQNAAGWILWLAEHHQELHQWYTETVASGEHRRFKGTTTAQYFCEVIRSLEEYVDEEDYSRIVGLKFGQWLDSPENAKEKPCESNP